MPQEALTYVYPKALSCTLHTEGKKQANNQNNIDISRHFFVYACLHTLTHIIWEREWLRACEKRGVNLYNGELEMKVLPCLLAFSWRLDGWQYKSAQKLQMSCCWHINCFWYSMSFLAQVVTEITLEKEKKKKVLTQDLGSVRFFHVFERILSNTLQ